MALSSLILVVLLDVESHQLLRGSLDFQSIFGGARMVVKLRYRGDILAPGRLCNDPLLN